MIQITLIFSDWFIILMAIVLTSVGVSYIYLIVMKLWYYHLKHKNDKLQQKLENGIEDDSK